MIESKWVFIKMKKNERNCKCIAIVPVWKFYKFSIVLRLSLNDISIVELSNVFNLVKYHWNGEKKLFFFRIFFLFWLFRVKRKIKLVACDFHCRHRLNRGYQNVEGKKIWYELVFVIDLQFFFKKIRFGEMFIAWKMNK